MANWKEYAPLTPTTMAKQQPIADVGENALEAAEGNYERAAWEAATLKDRTADAVSKVVPENSNSANGLHEKATFLVSKVTAAAADEEFEIILAGKKTLCWILPITKDVVRIYLEPVKFGLVEPTIIEISSDGKTHVVQGPKLWNPEIEALFDVIFTKLSVSQEVLKTKLRIVKDGNMWTDVKSGTISYDLIGICDADASEENDNLAFVALHFLEHRFRGAHFDEIVDRLIRDKAFEDRKEEHEYRNRVVSTIARLVDAKAISRQGMMFTSNVDWSSTCA